MLAIAIGITFIVIAGYFIFKGHSATGVLFAVGVALLAIATLLGNKIIPKGMKPTGWPALDIVDYLRHLMADRNAGLGLMIMILVGFAAYMTHIGANGAVVRLLAAPLRRVRSPYVVVAVAFILGSAMSLAVGSATGLGVLLMATFFPLMIGLGISRAAAAAVCASTASVILSPITADVALAAEKSNEPLAQFAIQKTLPISIITLVAMAIAHFWWQRRLDKRVLARAEASGGDLEPGDVSVAPADVETERRAPLWYAVLPFVPIILVLVFDGKIAPKLDLVTVVLLAVLVTIAVELVRQRLNGRKVLKDLEAGYKGMGDAFTNVVILVVAAGVFAQGLNAVGFVDALLGGVSGAGGTGVVVMLVLVAITLVVSITTGSGNAAFYAFVELIPKLAAQMGIHASFLIIPMLQVSNMARPLSPVSGVLVACAGIAKLSPIEIIKRTIVPSTIGIVVMIISSLVLVPMA